MKKSIWTLALFVLFVFASFVLVAAICDAGASNKQQQQQTAQGSGEEYKYQESGKPLYFDPDKAQGTQVDDAAPYSDPWYGKENKYRGGHGSQAGPKGKVDDSQDVRVIEGPVHYEVVKEPASKQPAQQTPEQQAP